MATAFRFEQFTLDRANRQLARDGTPVDLNGRYFDALTLLVREQGQLVTKDRFLDEVWRGVPVTDEALTQCIKTLRRQLGDDAARPRFIETVPKYGYRFVAPVQASDGPVPSEPAVSAPGATSPSLLLAAGGTVGGGIAGLIGGIFYGFAATSQPLQPGMGAISVLLVLVALTVLVALIGAFGVAFGIVLAGRISRTFSWWSVLGGGVGGLIVGAITKLLGLDAFNLLLGQSPGNITGGGEGFVLGSTVGLGTWFASQAAMRLRRSVSMAALAGAAAGIVITAMGGRLMGGSLDLLAHTLAGSRLRLDHVGRLFGESGFGRISQLVTGALEGALFAGFVVGAMILAHRSLPAQKR